MARNSLLHTPGFRLALYYAAIFSLSVSILGVVVFWTARVALEQQMDARILAESQSLLRDYEAGGLARLVQAVQTRARSTAALDYLVLDRQGMPIAGSLPKPPGTNGWFYLSPAEAGSAATDTDKGITRALVQQLPEGELLVVGDDRDRIDDVEEAILRAFGWALAVTFALAAAGGLIIGRGFLRRIDAIAATAEAISAGDLGHRIALTGWQADLGPLTATLNRMLDRIQVLMESLRQVSNDIAHDLRTPLARLRRRLEQARSGDLSASESQTILDAAIGDVDGILATFSALLRIAEIEAGSRRAAFQLVDLSAIAVKVVDAFSPSADERGQGLTLSVDPACPALLGDKDLLVQLLANLVENALCHTPAGTQVRVALECSAEQILLSVTDTGPGVAAGERERIIGRFYRLESSRTTPGSGLGLSLANAIAALHGATLQLADAQPGLRVSVRFGRRARVAGGAEHIVQQ